MNQDMTKYKPTLGMVLLAVFAIAMIMGPGPGLYLINPDPADPDAVRTVLGLPIVYAWGLLWYAVQAAVLIIAYFKVWSEDEPGRG